MSRENERVPITQAMSDHVKKYLAEHDDMTQVALAELTKGACHGNDVSTIVRMSQPSFTRRKIAGFAIAIGMPLKEFLGEATEAHHIAPAAAAALTDIPPGFTVQRCGPHLAILAMAGETHQALSWFAGLPADEQEKMQRIHETIVA